MSYPATPPQPPAQTAPPRNGLGLAGFILGLIGILVSFIPVVGVVAWPLVIVGLVLSIVGFMRVNKGVANNKGLAIAGMVLSVVGLLAVIGNTLLAGVLFGAATDVVDESKKTSTVIYDVTGDSPTADVLYTTTTAGDIQTGEEKPTTLPWHKEAKATGVVRGGGMTVSTGEGGGSVTCTLTIDGKVISKNTATGAFTSASCNQF